MSELVWIGIKSKSEWLPWCLLPWEFSVFVTPGDWGDTIKLPCKKYTIKIKNQTAQFCKDHSVWSCRGCGFYSPASTYPNLQCDLEADFSFSLTANATAKYPVNFRTRRFTISFIMSDSYSIGRTFSGFQTGLNDVFWYFPCTNSTCSGSFWKKAVPK